MASSMLKRTLESQKSQGSPSKRPANVTRPAAAHQSKLTGRITKPSTQAMTDSSPKRKGVVMSMREELRRLAKGQGLGRLDWGSRLGAALRICRSMRAYPVACRNVDA